MAMDERKRQKKLAKNKSKQRRQHQAVAFEKQLLASTAGMMRTASHGNVLHCLLGTSGHAEQNGMVTVTLVRSGPRGQVALALFMVDLWCLGVKDCSGRLMAPSTCRETLDDMRDRLPDTMSISPAQAHAIVVGGVRYAESLGLAPHADYSKLAPIWTGIPVDELPAGLQLGKDGRPCYVVGPYDDDAKQNRILHALFDSVGEGNFDFVSALSQQNDDISHVRIKGFRNGEPEFATSDEDRCSTHQLNASSADSSSAAR